MDDHKRTSTDPLNVSEAIGRVRRPRGPGGLEIRGEAPSAAWNQPDPDLLEAKRRIDAFLEQLAEDDERA